MIAALGRLARRLMPTVFDPPPANRAARRSNTGGGPALDRHLDPCHRARPFR